jgi:hypothetical protein
MAVIGIVREPLGHEHHPMPIGTEHVVFQILGPLRVTRDDRPIAITALMWRRLLAALLSRAGEPIPTPILIEALWADCPPPSASCTAPTDTR